MWKRVSAAPRRGPWIRKGVCTFLVPPRKVPKRRRAKGDTRRGHALRSMCRLRLRAAPSGWEPVPPGCPPPLSEGVMGRCGHRPLRVCSGNDSVPLNCLAYGQSSSLGDVPTLILPSFAPPWGILPIRGPRRGDILRNVHAFGAAPSGREPVPPGCPPPLSEGVLLHGSPVTSPCT